MIYNTSFNLFKFQVISENCEELQNKQEEADTKVFLCVRHAKNTLDLDACITTVDTDIAVYALYFSDISNIYIKIGAADRKRILDISKIATVLGENVHCMHLPETIIHQHFSELEREKPSKF